MTHANRTALQPARKSNPLPRRILTILVASLLLTALIPNVMTASAEDSIFTKTDGFATKTGFRFVFSWAASEPVSPTIQYGTDPSNLNLTAKPVPATGIPDTAGLVIADNRTLVGQTIYWRAVDDLTGQASEIKSFEARNAYTAWDAEDRTYTLNLLVTLDSESLPEEIPADLALENIADGMNVFAERLYDAMDGYARLGKVLITDTNLDYPANVPDAVPVSFTGGGPLVCPAGNLSDVQIETAPPFDSHTWGGFAINDECTSFYVGREGQLVVPWEDDLHLGYVSTHEMMHYAFAAPDLYNVANISQAAPIPGDGQSWCRNEAWDGSVMHNTGGWSGLRWTLTELDRNPVTTPCDHEGKPYTWDVLRQRYTNVPDSPRTGPIGNGIEHMVDDQARGNEDGGALEITILDRSQATASSTCTSFTPDDTNDPKPPIGEPCSEPGVAILGDGAGDSLPGNGTGLGLPEHDVRELTISEPEELGAGKMVFRLKMESLANPPPNTTWPVIFKDHTGQDRFVRMSTNALLQVSFASGLGTNADPIAHPGTPADASSSFDPDGTIRIVVDRANIGNSPVGANLTHFQTRVRFELQTSTGCSAVIGVTGPLPPPALCPVSITPDNMPDDLGRTGTYTIVGSENCGNALPVAVDDNASTDEDQFVTIPVLSNDTDADDDSLSITSVGSSQHGSASKNLDGTITYFPAPDYNGSDSFSYTIEDGNGGSATATVNVAIAAVNDSPIANDDSGTVKKNRSVTIGILENDSDIEGDSLSISSVSEPANGAVTINSDGTITYTPRRGYTGADSFTYTVSDGNGGTGSATVTMEVSK